MQRWPPARVGLLALAGALTLAGVGIRHRGSLSLMEVFGDPPADPILSPLLMGYEGYGGLAREIARVAEPLGGAWGHSQRQQQQLYRAPATNGGGQGVYELVPVGEAQQQGDGRGLEGLVRPGFVGGGGYSPELARGRVRASQLRQEGGLAERERKPLTDEGEELLLGRRPGQPGSSALEMLRSRDEALAGRLSDEQDREEAAWLLKEDAVARRLRATVDSQLSLHNMEGELEKTDAISQAKFQKAQQMRRDAIAELRRYREEQRDAEVEGERQVKFLRAARGYAAKAQGEMRVAAAMDHRSEDLIARSDKVLKLAHEAEVKARVVRSPQILAQARAEVNQQLAEVRGAEQAQAAAKKEKAAARYDAYMSNVLERVRSKYAKDAVGVRELARLGRDGEKELREADAMLRTAEQTGENAEVWLKRAKHQDSIRDAADKAMKHTGETLEKLSDIEREDATRREEGVAGFRRIMLAKKREEAAKREEEAAAALGSRV